MPCLFFQSKILPPVWNPFPTAQAYNYNSYNNGLTNALSTGLSNGLANSSLSGSIGKSWSIP